MDEKKTNKEIIDEVNIAQSQLTNYKRVIVLGKLDELNNGKALYDIIKENKGIKIKKEIKTKEQSISEDIDRNLAKRVKKEQDKIALNKRMRERIEYLEQHGLEENAFEYFSAGEWKVYVPIPTGLTDDPQKEIRDDALKLQNFILRCELDESVERVEKDFRLRLKKIKKDCDIQKKRNNELSAQLNTLILTEQRSVDECLVELNKEIADLKKQLVEAKEINQEEVKRLVSENTKNYEDLLEEKDFEIKHLKEMLCKCERERRDAVHRNTKKYLASMAGFWENNYRKLEEDYRGLFGSKKRRTSV